MTSVASSEPWYVARGRRGQELLDQGRGREAVQAFQAVLADLGGEAGYGRAVLLERLGRALLLAGEHDAAHGRFREALELAGRLAPSDTVRRLRGALRSGLGDALRSLGRTAEARRAYLAALEIEQALGDRRSEGVDQARLGALALADGDTAEALARSRAAVEALGPLGDAADAAAARHQLGRVHRRRAEWDEAARHLEEAARLWETTGRPDAAARIHGELVELHRETGRVDEAVRWCRRLVDDGLRAGPSLELARRMLLLSELLGERPGGVEEARALAAQALAVAQRIEPTAPEAWAAYDRLGALTPGRADLRELARRAPLIVEAAARVGPAPGLGRAVILARLARCFAAGARPDLATAYLREAQRVAEQLVENELVLELREMLRLELDPPRSEAAGNPEPGPAPVGVTERTETDYAFEPNLLLDGPRRRRTVRLEPAAVADSARPMLVPGTRTWLDPEGRIRAAPLAGEPRVEMTGGCTVLRRTSTEVVIGDGTDLVWRLIGAMDGTATWAAILATMPEADRPRAAEVVGTLAAAGAVDLTSRPLGRFVHWCTKKGVLPAGGLEGEEVLRLASEPAPHDRAGGRRLPVAGAVPTHLEAFHALTRVRRSTREYRGAAISRAELEALLATACGVTGSVRWPGGEVKLRAYPSSGALYAVGIYPVAFRVEGVAPAVYRLDPERSELEVIREPLEPERFVHAGLPMERELLAGVSAMVCLTGRFARHERKYGEGGYRMLVAEAGHVSQNLVLAATALGFAARPFGGVFDALVNEALGLDEGEEFLLSVVVGR